MFHAEFGPIKRIDAAKAAFHWLLLSKRWLLIGFQWPA